VQNLAKFLFELASEDRLKILFELQRKPQSLSQLSRKLNLTVQEASRNIIRLNESKLLVRNADGSYKLSPLAEETLNLVPGFEFLLKNRGYFLTHTSSFLPKEFSSNWAALVNCELVNDVMVMFHNIESMINEASEYVWILADQILASAVPLLLNALERGVKLRVILPRDLHPPEDVFEQIQNPVYKRAAESKRFEARSLETVNVMICLSEAEVAALSFPNLDGRLDYLGFKARNESTHTWLKALYDYYWSTANPDN
jgi:predicted transcriptional regulator